MTVTCAAEMEMAGMVDEDGVLGRSPVPTNTPLLPASVELKSDRLVWSRLYFGMPDSLREKVQAGSTRKMLDSFVKMRNGNDVLRFAETHGVLGLCEHGFPAEHNPPPQTEFARVGTHRPSLWCRPLGFYEDFCWEPVDRWLYFARQAKAVLQIAAALHRKERASEEDWLAIYEGRPELESATRDLATSGDRDYQVDHLQGVVNEWLALGNVRPRLFWWREREPSFRLVASGAFGILAIQLMTAVARARDLFICSGCGNPYYREGRKPKPGQRNNCTDKKCLKIADRDRQRDWRKKHPKKEAASGRKKHQRKQGKE